MVMMVLSKSKLKDSYFYTDSCMIIGKYINILKNRTHNEFTDMLGNTQPYTMGTLRRGHGNYLQRGFG
ncbi:MAG: hypothetical protein ACLU7U_03445 [Romboutsia timonensis]